MNRRKLFFYIALFFASPVIFNYLLLSWRAPGVSANAGDWLGFFANFIGLIGAVSIAVFQFKKQRENDERSDVETNRSFIDIQDYNATMMLVDVKTHENSRIVTTDGYEEIKDNYPPTHFGGMQIPYLKITHFGIPPVITNCTINYEFVYSKSGLQLHEENNYFLGTIEKDIEVFIPLTPIGMDPKTEIQILNLTFYYTTLKGEQLRYSRDAVLDQETLVSLGMKSYKNMIYKSDLKTVMYIYPNKIKNK